MIGWLRLNLALLLAATSVLSGAIGFLIHATIKLTEIQAASEDHTHQLAGLHGDMVSVDHRLNDQHATEVMSMAEQDKRLSLIEAQLRWAIDRAPSLPSRR